MVTKREVVFSLLRRQGLHGVPVDFNLCPFLEQTYREKTGGALPYREYFNMPLHYLPPLRLENEDLKRFDKYHPDKDENTTIDQCGVGHRRTATSMHMSRMLCPLRDADSPQQILEYPLPVARADNIDWIRQEVQRAKQQDTIACANMTVTLWETAWYIRGMENLMADMLCNEPMAQVLLDRIADTACANAALYAAGGVELLLIGDDIGMQHTTMMSVEQYRKWLKPRLRRFVETVRHIRPDTLIMYHSCGFIEPFIPDLIEVGIDILNPVQPECMDFGKIHAQYGDVLSFHGTIGTQTTMPFGSPEDVRREVEKNLCIAGDKGGLFPAPTHLLEPEVPWENILAYVDACQRYS